MIILVLVLPASTPWKVNKLRYPRLRHCSTSLAPCIRMPLNQHDESLPSHCPWKCPTVLVILASYPRRQSFRRKQDVPFRRLQKFQRLVSDGSYSLNTYIRLLLFRLGVLKPFQHHVGYTSQVLHEKAIVISTHPPHHYKRTYECQYA